MKAGRISMSQSNTEKKTCMSKFEVHKVTLEYTTQRPKDRQKDLGSLSLQSALSLIVIDCERSSHVYLYIVVFLLSISGFY